MATDQLLLQRRAEVLKHNTAQASTRHSGWHPGDPGAEQRDNRKELPLAKRPVVIQEDDTCYLVGDDVARVQAVLKAYIAKQEPKIAAGELTPYEIQTVACARLACAQQGKITLPTQKWNYTNHGLAAMGVQCVHTMAAGALHTEAAPPISDEIASLFA